MCRKPLHIIFIFTLFFLIWPAAQAFTTLPPGPKPVQVKVGLYLNDILGMSEENETIRFDAMQIFRWQDKRLSFSKEQAGTDVKYYETEAAKILLSKIWHPQLTLVHGTSPRQLEMMRVSVTSDGVVTWSEDFQASTEMHMDLRRFPFDKQVVRVNLAPFAYDASHVQLQNFKGYSGAAIGTHITGWSVRHFVARVTTEIIPPYKTPFSIYHLIIHYDRISNYYIFQIFIPVMLIVLFAFSVFWMLNNPIVNRVAISLTAVLAIVVFQWRISIKLPQVPYHTLTETFLLTSFIIAGSTIIASLILENKASSNLHLVKMFRVFYPICYFLAVFIVAIVFLG